MTCSPLTQYLLTTTIFAVNIPPSDTSTLAKDAHLAQGQRVVAVSKYTGEEQRINLNLLPEILLFKCLSGPLEGRLFLGKKEWLHHITDTCLTGTCYTCIMAISRGPIYLDKEILMPNIPNSSERHAGVTGPTITGGEVLLKAGRGCGEGHGGSVTITAGQGGATGCGGNLSIIGGQGGASASQGDFIASDGTRQMFFDASKGKLKMSNSKLENKLILKKEKLKIKQHQHANECMMEERKQLSRERIAIQCSKYEMLSTAIRWIAASATIGSCAYFLI